MSAGGSYVLAMILFKRKNMNHRLTKGAPPGFLGTPSDTRWMDAKLFVKYMTYFIAHTMPSENHQLLVVFDGHRSHTSLEVVELAKQHHITLLTLPRHTIHRLQPLDVSFFWPLQNVFNKDMVKWMTNHPGKRVIDYDFYYIFSLPYLRVVIAEKAIKGFACTEIYQFNTDIFNPDDFAPSSIYDRTTVTTFN